MREKRKKKAREKTCEKEKISSARSHGYLCSHQNTNKEKGLGAFTLQRRQRAQSMQTIGPQTTRG